MNNDEIEKIKDDLYDVINKLNGLLSDKTVEEERELLLSFDDFVQRIGLSTKNVDYVIFRKELLDFLDIVG
jgi:hypothetical protein